MSNQTMTLQAALMYPKTPSLALDALRDTLNAALSARGIAPLAVSPMSSEQFVLLANDDLHASVAVHATPLGDRGFERALASPVTRAKAVDFAAELTENAAHVLVAVGDGPAPLAFDTPAPAAITAKAVVLHALIALVISQARPAAAHLSACDLFLTTDDLTAALGECAAPMLLVHPAVTAPQTGPDGAAGSGLILHQSHHLIGKTLVIEGIPAPVPLDMSLTLAETLMRQFMSGDLTLEDGATLRQSTGMSLHIRHMAGDAACPAGRIVVSFWSAAPDTAAADTPAFAPHPGYSAISAPPPADAADDADGWAPMHSSGARISAAPQTRGPSTWMVLVGIGLFLWVGLPMLNVPQKIIQSAFSNTFEGEFAKP